MNNTAFSSLFYKVFTLTLILLITISCVEEFETDSIKFERLLVVDGDISDQEKIHTVKLSYTSPIENNESETYEPVLNASVWVEDDLGNRVDFTEELNGTYTSPSTFAGEVGRHYALFITMSDGKSYQSSFQELVAAPEITSIYNRYFVDQGDGVATSIPGAQFFIDVENTSSNAQFFRYEWNDSHKVVARYTKLFDALEVNPGNFSLVPFNEDVKICYRESNSSELLLANANNSQNNQLLEIPIRFIAAENFDLTDTYSIEVTQRALSADAYSFYSKLKNFNDANGSLFDKQQGVVVGNVYSTSDANEKVLGFFEVSGAKSKRIFLSLSELDDQVLDHIFNPCTQTELIEFEGTLNEFYNAVDVPEEDKFEAIIARSVYEIFDMYGDFIVLGHRLCVDCRYRGSLDKPDYWP